MHFLSKMASSTSAKMSTQQIQLRPLDHKDRESVADHTEKFIGSNWRISHHLKAEKDAGLMSSVPVFVWQRQGRNRAGLLILRANEPVIFWNTEQDQPYAIKLQVPATLTHKGTCVLVATLSKAEKLLTLEDIWVYENNSLLRSKKYSERWPILEEVFNELNKQPDKHISLGCELQLIVPMSFNEFIAATEMAVEDGTVWEFQPDVPIRRRLVWSMPAAAKPMIQSNAIMKSRSIYDKPLFVETSTIPVVGDLLNKMDLIRSKGQIPIHTGRLKPTTQPQPRIHNTNIQMQRCGKLILDPRTNLPDSYLLESMDGPIGRICVPRLQQSQEIRKEFLTKKQLFVDVKWNSGFKKYEITKILPETTPLSASTMFHEHLEEDV